MKRALVIMAAGIGSRFGGGIKQLAKVGKNGEVIIDYTIHDAIKAGFNKIVFIIRRDIEAEFREVIGDRIDAICDANGVETVYVFQDKENIPSWVSLPGDREKPWGTGHAILACKDVIDCPFVVVNADDYYGTEALKNMYEYLKAYDESSDDGSNISLAGYVLKNTLSENGTVTRGLCYADAAGNLERIAETKNIAKTIDGAEADGVKISADTLCSMNMWALTPGFVKLLEDGFEEFFKQRVGDNADSKLDVLKDEFLIPIFVGDMLNAGKMSVKVIPTNDVWFGITYLEDKPKVMEAFAKLIEDGVYQERLFDDL